MKKKPAAAKRASLSENLAAWAKDPAEEVEEEEEEDDEEAEEEEGEEKRDKGKGRKYSVDKDGLPQHIKDLIENTKNREKKSMLINKLYSKDAKTGRYKINADVPEFEDFHIHIWQFHSSLYLKSSCDSLKLTNPLRCLYTWNILIPFAI